MVGAWMVAMETDAKLTYCKRGRGRFQAARGVKELVLDILHSPAKNKRTGHKNSAGTNED